MHAYMCIGSLLFLTCMFGADHLGLYNLSGSCLLEKSNSPSYSCLVEFLIITFTVY